MQISVHQSPLTIGCSSERGFSLLELMVVILVAGLISGIALVKLPTLASNSESVADSLALQLRQAREHAVMAGRPVGLWVTSSAYYFARRERSGWQRLSEQAVQHQVENPRRRWEASRDGKPVALSAADPILLTLTTGLHDWTHAELRLSEDGAQVVRIGFDDN